MMGFVMSETAHIDINTGVMTYKGAQFTQKEIDWLSKAFQEANKHKAEMELNSEQ